MNGFDKYRSPWDPKAYTGDPIDQEKHNQEIADRRRRMRDAAEARAMGAMYSTQHRINKVMNNDGNLDWVPHPDDQECYEDILDSIQKIHTKRLEIVTTALQKYLDNGIIRIEDGGIKSQEAAIRKKKHLTYSPYGLHKKLSIRDIRDISRFRIITKDLSVLLEVVAELSQLEDPNFGISYMNSTYNLRKNGNIYPAVFMTVRDPRSIVSTNTDDPMDDGENRISSVLSTNPSCATEIQILTEGNYKISQRNHDIYKHEKYLDPGSSAPSGLPTRDTLDKALDQKILDKN